MMSELVYRGNEIFSLILNIINININGIFTFFFQSFYLRSVYIIKFTCIGNREQHLKSSNVLEIRNFHS